MKQIISMSVFSVILLFVGTVFGQTYSGPAVGSVDTGVVVTTDDFSFAPIGSEPPSQDRMVDNVKDPDFGPIYYQGDKKVFDNYVYVEDKNAQLQGGGEIGPNFELHSFPSVPMTNSIPPDPHMAVGPNHVIAMVNTRFHIYDREGNLLKNISADAWTGQVLPSPGAFDPQIIYDHYAGRWFMLWDNQDDNSSTAFFLIAYSDDDDPLGTWYMYAIDATANGSTTTNTWGDYPQLGYDDQAIYINSRQFTFSGNYRYNKIRIINKSELYAANGGPFTWTDIWNIRDVGGSNALDVIHPVISYDPSNNFAYFVWANRQGANKYVLYKINDPLGTPTLSGVNLPVPFYGPAPLSNQLGGGNPRLDSGGSSIKNAPILRDGLIYAVHAIRNSQFATNSSLKYFVVDPSTNAVTEQVEQGAQGFYFSYPAITVDNDHNLAITYSRSADTEYIGAYYSTKLGTDPAGLSPSKEMMAGQGNYVVTFGGSRNRWGDYLSAALDPANGYNIWLFSEYAAATNQWGTWLTEIRMKPYAGVSLYTKNNPIEFGNIEIGTDSTIQTVTISNYGEDALVINSIATPVGPFRLLTELNFPVTLNTYDSLDLEIVFNPSTPAVYSELMNFDDNDPDFTGLILEGTGYEINPTYKGVFYSSTGETENGVTLTINKTTGEGTVLGESNFTDLRSLTTSPLSSVTYGISTRNTGTDLVRINGTGGDGFTQYTLDLGNMAGITFDSTGVLYGAKQSGEIYTIDLSDGSYSLVTTASIQLDAIEIDPFSNILYGVPKVVIGAKDKIYTIDMTSGDATLVGQTGFGKRTNDMAFDEMGELYGVIGGENESGQLIKINTTDGSGTMVGDINFEGVMGLTYAINGIVNSVESDNTEGTKPEEYSLSQNYPNPFNPSTTIKFSLPEQSGVRLTIYNLLGQEVTEIVNEEMSAGKYSVVWNGTDRSGLKVSSGVYLYKIRANGKSGKNFTKIRKMILLK